MAAQLPIVGTAIADVAQPYGHVVAIAGDSASFVAACEDALAQDEQARLAMLDSMRAIVAGTSWNVTAEAMRSLLESTPRRCAAARFEARGDVAASGARVNPLRTQSGAQRVQTAVIGAGPTGLSAAYHLGEGTVLLEKNARVGGWGPTARLGYPLSGGFQALMSGFLSHIKSRIEMNAVAAQLLPREHLLVMADGSRYRYDHLVSTMPLPELVGLIGAEAPEEVKLAAKGLRHISVRCVNLGVARVNITDKHWIYYPEETIFHRIFVQGNASPHCNPPGGFGLTCEISYSPWKPLPLEGQALIDRCVADCVPVGMLRESDRLMTSSEIDMPYVYVIYDHAKAANVATVKDWLALYDIVLAGRYSEWEYYNSDHAFLAGMKAAEAVLRQSQRSPKAWGRNSLGQSRQDMAPRGPVRWLMTAPGLQHR